MKASEVIIKEFNPEYQAGVLDLIVGIQQNEFQIPITAKDQPDLTDIPGFYQQGAGNFWVALNGAEVTGTVSLLDIGNGRVALRKMFVAPEFRGAAGKTSSGLLQTALKWARDKNIREIFLGTTDKFLAAHRFYEKNGFQRVDKESLPPEFPVMSVDTIFFHFLAD